jgi:transglutaminase-like putative cysteine protease
MRHRHHTQAARPCLDAGYLWRFADRASQLRFENIICIGHAPAGFRPAEIEHFARTYPFAYAAEDRPGLARFIAQMLPHPMLDRWAAGFLRDDGSADTYALLVSMTQTIKRTFRHGARHQKGTQEPIRTLELASGSCRDLAVLMIAALRSLGIAARFVSGYLHIPDDDDRLTGGNTHAWVQPMFPGPAGSTSIHRAARSEIRTWCASRSRASRARRSPCKAHGSGPRRTISP